MPRKYKRSVTAPSRAAWSEEQLREAIEKVSTNKISAREAHRRYGVLGKDNEKRLVTHIQRLTAAGFAPDRQQSVHLLTSLQKNCIYSIHSQLKKKWQVLLGCSRFWKDIQNSPLGKQKVCPCPEHVE
ncbi:hypothetical protein NQ318_020698 [Aromia moschata]|uniref:Uncharacterized protein n=1 Tax=Aromia moschata TaxID=1265417 RepID=A0AAV8XQA7_9CUCU|nr:hypothetical protein NQ318_020698 [Aromia moschata]